MKTFCVFKKFSGEIQYSIECSTDPILGEGQDLLELLEGDPIVDSTSYVVEGHLVPRPDFPNPNSLTLIADGESEISWVGIPTTVEILIDGVSICTVDDGEFILTMNTPGIYTVEMNAEFPYKHTTWTVTANAP